MNPYYKFLYILWANGPYNWSNLKRIARNQPEGIIDECLAKHLIAVVGQNQIGEDLYSVTSEGRQILDNSKIGL